MRNGQQRSVSKRRAGTAAGEVAARPIGQLRANATQAAKAFVGGLLWRAPIRVMSHSVDLLASSCDKPEPAMEVGAILTPGGAVRLLSAAGTRLNRGHSRHCSTSYFSSSREGHPSVILLLFPMLALSMPHAAAKCDGGGRNRLRFRLVVAGSAPMKRSLHVSTTFLVQHCAAAPHPFA